MGAFRIFRRLQDLLDVNPAGLADNDVPTWDAATSKFTMEAGGGGGGGAPTNADYLVGTADAALSNEIVVGPTPGGELGNTWASPTVDTIHSGSSHAATQAAAEAASVILAPASSARNVIQPTAGTVIAAIVKAHAAQSVDLQQWQKSDGTPLVQILKDGGVTISPDVSAAGLRINQKGLVYGVDYGFRIDTPGTLDFGSVVAYVSNLGGDRSGTFELRAWNALGTALTGYAYQDTLYGLNIMNNFDWDFAQFGDYTTQEFFARIDKDGRYITAAHAAPVSGDLVNGEIAKWYDATNGAAKLMHTGKTLDGTVVTWTIPNGVVYVAGGTDVAVADGGTGASTAAGARTNLDVPSNAEAILDVLVDAKGDLLAGTAADTVARVAVGANAKALVADSTATPGMAWGVPGLVYSITLGADTASVDTGAVIPGGFNLLEIYLYTRTDEAVTLSTIRTNFNADATAIYDNNLILVAASALTSARLTAQNGLDFVLSGASAAANVFSTVRLTIPAYAGSVGYKAGTGEWGLPSSVGGNDVRMGTTAFEWRSTAAITRVSFAPVTAAKKLLAGTQLMVYVR